MSLKAFIKGFSTTAGPTFLRGFEQGSQRRESRRQDERQDKRVKEGYEREDKVRTEDLQREDHKTAIADGKATLLGAANTGDSEAVTKAFGEMSPEMQGALRLTLGRYKYTATRKKKELVEKDELHKADLAAKGGALLASQQRGALSEHRLEQEKIKVSGVNQFNKGVIEDGDGVSAASAAFFELIKDGVTSANAPQAARIAKSLDTYLGSSEYSVMVQQGKISGDDLRTEHGIMGDLARYSPDMIIGIANKMEAGPSRDRLLELAKGMGQEIIDIAADGMYQTAYNYNISIGKTPKEASLMASEGADRYRVEQTKRGNRVRLQKITEFVVKKFDAGEGQGNIEAIMKEIKKIIRGRPDLTPGRAELDQVRKSLMFQLGLSETPPDALVDVDPVPGVEVGPKPVPVTPPAESPEGGWVSPGSLWDKWGLPKTLPDLGAGRGGGRGGGRGLGGGGGWGGIVDSTRGR
jgi:hypothetical protein